MLAYRVCKARHPVLDGTGAERTGARWNSPGAPVIYASTCSAGSLLEILAHRGRTRLPGVHHAGEILIPDDLPAARLEPADLPGWDAPESAVARAHGQVRSVSRIVVCSFWTRSPSSIRVSWKSCASRWRTVW